MKLIEFKEYNNAEGKTLNKKKVAITCIIAIMIVIMSILTMIYMYSSKFRNWADIHILMKTVKQGTLASIDISYGENITIYAYDKYIALLNDNRFEIYNSSAKKIETLDINVSNPIFTANGRYASIAERDKQRLYLISGTKKIWEKDIEGSISRVSVNENGYVSVVCTGTTYKSVILVFDQIGNELFKTYIPNNKVIDSEISSDNKYLSFAEVDTSGTLIKSAVKTISIKDAKSSSENSMVYTYEMPTNSLVINLKYQGSKNLICMCDDGISVLTDGNINQIMEFKEDNKKYTYAGINLINTAYEIREDLEDLSKQVSNVRLINTRNKKRK